MNLGACWHNFPSLFRGELFLITKTIFRIIFCRVYYSFCLLIVQRLEGQQQNMYSTFLFLAAGNGLKLRYCETKYTRECTFYVCACVGPVVYVAHLFSLTKKKRLIQHWTVYICMSSSRVWYITTYPYIVYCQRWNIECCC